MSKLEERLSAAFAEDEPPARDMAFNATVLKRIEQRNLLLDLAVQGAFAVVASALLWALWPTLGPAIRDWTPTLVPAVVIVAGVLSLLLADRMLESVAARR